MLRVWQEECISAALLKYHLGQTNFLAMATPGAGKTCMAAYLASRLFELDRIDLVICFTPSINVNNSFQENLERITERRMNGRMGSAGQVMTYHNLTFLSGSFWQIFKENRVFVIFDEIHHCSGENINLSNAWGEKILVNIRSKAAYTLALSGTPWRSDKLPIALARYSGDPKRLECDYIYPLTQAIKDKVCRIPKIVAIDNDSITHKNSAGESTSYSSLSEVLSNANINYSDLLYHDSIVEYTLRQAIRRLDSIHQKNPRAAGLIVASSIHHAHWIGEILTRKLEQNAIIVTHQHTESQSIIDGFEESCSHWIIAVGMISEGTNIPRLQVCCYLSRIKTELYFRQVLGRIVRAKEEHCPYAYLYTLAEETLLDYARRIGDDLPDHLSIVEIEKIGDNTELSDLPVAENPNEAFIENSNATDGDAQKNKLTEDELTFNNILPEEIIQKPINKNQISLFGKFSEELIVLQNAFNS